MDQLQKTEDGNLDFEYSLEIFKKTLYSNDDDISNEPIKKDL
jgi:hypothetical protein